MARERVTITKCESIWGARPPSKTEQAKRDEVSLGEYLLDCMKANERVGKVYHCPNCGTGVQVSQEGDEEHVVCNGCGLVAIDGTIVVKGA